MAEQTFLRDGKWVPMSQLKKIEIKKKDKIRNFKLQIL